MSPTIPAATLPRSWVCAHCEAPLDINLDHVGECPPGGGPFDCSGSFSHPRGRGQVACLLDGMDITHVDARDVTAIACAATFDAKVNDFTVPARCVLPRGHAGDHRVDYNGIRDAVTAPAGGGASAADVAKALELVGRASDLEYASPGAFGDQVRELLAQAMRALGATDVPGAEDGPAGGRFHTRRARR